MPNLDQNFIYILSLIFLIFNIGSCLLMYLDKQRSRQHKERIPEGVMFFSAIFFMSLGIWIGMYLFRHKNKKWYFILGVPLAFMQNIVFLKFFL